jgi:hypothetical protein
MSEESILQDKILRDLDSMGRYCVAFKIIKSSVNGTPDIFFITSKSGPVFIETKRIKGGASKLQGEMHKNIAACNGLSFFCHTWPQWIAIKKTLGL